MFCRALSLTDPEVLYRYEVTNIDALTCIFKYKLRFQGLTLVNRNIRKYIVNRLRSVDRKIL